MLQRLWRGMFIKEEDGKTFCPLEREAADCHECNIVFCHATSAQSVLDGE